MLYMHCTCIQYQCFSVWKIEMNHMYNPPPHVDALVRRNFKHMLNFEINSLMLNASRIF